MNQSKKAGESPEKREEYKPEKPQAKNAASLLARRAIGDFK